MIAPVKKSVNHSRTVASMRGTGWEQQQEFGLLAFFAISNFFSRGNVELTFSFLLVLHLSLHAVCYAKNEISEH